MFGIKCVGCGLSCQIFSWFNSTSRKYYCNDCKVEIEATHPNLFFEKVEVKTSDEHITYEEHARVMRSLGLEPASEEDWKREKKEYYNRGVG